jgi:hypothetical protein
MRELQVSDYRITGYLTGMKPYRRLKNATQPLTFPILFFPLPILTFDIEGCINNQVMESDQELGKWIQECACEAYSEA